MVINLQFFGGRGSALNAAGSAKKNRGGIIDPSAEPREIEAVYRESRGYYGSYYKNEILQASADDRTGELSFDYATPEKREKTSKTNKTQYLTYKLNAGAEDGDTFGINWDKVKAVSGQTYGIRAELKISIHAPAKGATRHDRQGAS